MRPPSYRYIIQSALLLTITTGGLVLNWKSIERSDDTHTLLVLFERLWIMSAFLLSWSIYRHRRHGAQREEHSTVSTIFVESFASLGRAAGALLLLVVIIILLIVLHIAQYNPPQ